MHKHKTISNPGCWSHAKSNPLSRPSPYNAKDYKSGGRTTSIYHERSDTCWECVIVGGGGRNRVGNVLL